MTSFWQLRPSLREILMRMTSNLYVMQLTMKTFKNIVPELSDFKLCFFENKAGFEKWQKSKSESSRPSPPSSYDTTSWDSEWTMTELLTVPLKRGSDVDLGGPLTRWIQVRRHNHSWKSDFHNIFENVMLCWWFFLQSTFSSADQPADVAASVAALSKMRTGVVKLAERGEAGLNSASK